MNNKHFTHLHLHTDYSLLDGAIKLEQLVDFAKKNKFKAAAITDHGNIFGAVKFFDMAKKNGIKPILGIEAYLTDDVFKKDIENRYYHLILIVQNNIGYKNLCKLIAFSQKEGFYFKPRIDYSILEKYSQGLIAMTACLGGHIPNLLMQERYKEANDKIDWFLKTFSEDRFFLEVQPDNQKEQKILNEKLFNLAKERSLNLVATADCHYLNKEDREAHEVMLAIQTQSKITDPDRFTFGDCRAYVRTVDEMLEIFKDHEESIWNSGIIADKCDFDFETGKLFFPKFDIPDNISQEEYFIQLCNKGLKDLIDKNRIEKDKINIYQNRLNLEIDLIIKMGFISYFLIVSDFIQWAKNNEIPVGPGRGSAAGSLVAWSLKITDIDPIKYNLLFERFLNPERISMPDIDIDFCIEGRDKVINYVKQKYGEDKVCQIITFGSMLAKGVTKDVARVLGFSFEESNSITNLIPDQLKITLKEAIEEEPQLKNLIEKNKDIEKLFSIAIKLEGIVRHASKHAAGIVISPESVSDILPVYIPPKSNELVTQYAMTELEKLGFLKMDFLGLKNLTLIDRTIKLIKKNLGIDIDISNLDLNDKNSYKLLSQGDTSGVFQLESSGIKDVLKRLQPECFEDIIAVNALYRPGPLGSGMVDDFINRKHGREKIIYIFDELEPILKDTYGVIVYQEQVMKIASSIAGYSLGEADILRRAMGKKKADEMEKQRSIFTERASNNGFDKAKSGELFDLMAYFAGYGFNKSHSAAYALIAYQTAYLKANFKAEFMACLISLEYQDPTKMAFYIQEAKDSGLNILQPDINKSEIDFKVINKDNLLFGLGGIKNVGLAALENIINERNNKGPFKSLLNFCKRVDLRTAHKRVIESLIYSGALDTLEGNRAQKIEDLSKIIDIALNIKKSLKTGQLGLFSNLNSNDLESEENFIFSNIKDLEDNYKLEKEKEVLGLYISLQPLDKYKEFIKFLNISNISNLVDNHIVIIIGLIKSLKIVNTKKGEKMAFITIEDYSKNIEIVIFPKLFIQIENWLSKYKIFICKGIFSENKIKASKFFPIDLIFEQIIENISIEFDKDNFNEDNINKLKYLINSGNSSFDIKFNENGKNFKLIPSFKISIDNSFLEFIKSNNIRLFINI